MLIDQIIYARLKQDTTLNNLVSGRIYPTPPDNAALPYIYYATTNTTTESTMDGPSSLEMHTLSFQVYALTTKEVDEILTQLKVTLHGYRGGQIKYARLDSYSITELPKGYSALTTYSVWQDSEVLSQIIQIRRGTDKIITLRNLTSTFTGELVNDATVDAEIKNNNGDVIYSFNMPYISPGKYQYTIPDEQTVLMTDATYSLIVTVESAEGSTILTRSIRMLS